ncbi:MAG: type I methionyl aminopeptidase [Planctomycetes bacterium]|nr:type I methionyl aminopeptidase [Planctomycetota bacterium]MCB9826023.1 type I methionyl aminopeptidase [Planctomycetota bacterium]MCB9829221.1 type I methionyl aminopeptidase [Planctomycetota bacterium]
MVRRRRKPERAVILTPEEVEGMRVAGQFAAGLLDHVARMIEPGLTTAEIDAYVAEETKRRGGRSAPLGYPAGGRHPFPRSCCTSVNQVVCHGIPSEHQVLREGDIINVDVTPVIDGFHGDTSRTFIVGEADPEVRRLVNDTFEAMRRGIAVVRPGAHVGDIGHAIQTFAEARGHGVVRTYAGHGIGKVFHGPPTISHVGDPGTGEVFVPGMTFTVEPMINMGDWRCMTLSDHWTVVTADRSLSAQFEHTVSVTEDGVDILTLSPGATLDLGVG